MKFNTDVNKEAITVGDVKSNNVSIDTNNINFIVTILSTNLYSKPIESFIRETVSNAWDSHIEAGITEPVILELGVDTEDNYYCRVQDFGVGLSPERFNEVYRNIGSSTKRADNKQIGGFGIGRFSALAYSDIVYITSNYEGVQYKYMMYKDSNSISIDLLHQQETDERNGVQVQLELKNSGEITRFYTAIKQQLVYFENLYFIDNTETSIIPKDEFNNFHIKRYRDFLVNDLDSNSRNIDLILGKVRYPLRMDALSAHYPNYVRTYPISLKFEIGDLEVTPNREEILYSTKNIDKIQAVLDSAIAEVDEIFESHSNKDFSSLSEYIQAIQHSHQAPLLEVNDVNRVYITIPSNELKVTLKGKKYPKENFLKIYNHIMGASLIPFNYEQNSQKLNYYNGNINLLKLKTDFHKIYLCDVADFTPMTKSYVRETFEDGSKFIHSTKNVKFFIKKYIESVRTFGKKGNYNGATYDYRITKTILEFMLDNVKRIKTFSNKNVPQSYINQKKADEKAKRALRKNAGVNWSENVNIYKLRESDRGYSAVVANGETHKLSEIRDKYKRLVVYGDKDSNKLRQLFNIAFRATGRIEVIGVAPTRMKMVEKLENFVKIEDFMDVKYKLIRQIATAKLIQDTIPYLGKLRSIQSSLGKISTKLQDVVLELSAYQKMYISDKNRDEERKLIQEIYDLCVEKNYFDEVMKGVLNTNLEMLKQAEKILLFADFSYSPGIPADRINLVVDYILARRLFRPDIPAVVKLKQETILNIKIKKDEDNQD